MPRRSFLPVFAEKDLDEAISLALHYAEELTDHLGEQLQALSDHDVECVALSLHAHAIQTWHAFIREKIEAPDSTNDADASTSRLEDPRFAEFNTDHLDIARRYMKARTSVRAAVEALLSERAVPALVESIAVVVAAHGDLVATIGQRLATDAGFEAQLCALLVSPRAKKKGRA